LVFISNYMNHHQRPFCEELYKRFGESFCFISLKDMSDERRSLGYTDMNHLPFVCSVSDGSITLEEAERLCMTCDVLLVGSAEDRWFTKRLKAGKITVKFSERFFRKGKGLRHFLWDLLSGMRHIRRFQKYPLYFLCASAYTARDVNRFANFRNRTFRWGYFPKASWHEDVNSMIRKKNANSLIWVARYLDWKHPEAAIYVAKRLLQDGYDFTLEMLGNGPLLEQTRNQVQDNGLADRVLVRGAVAVEEVRKRMEQSQIFLFTSDQNEGWGAVLNEAMTSCCAVVSSDAAGATNFLVSHEENGFVFPSGDWEALYKNVKRLLDDSALRERIAVNAYCTIHDQWNAEVAAERLCVWIDCLKEGKNPNGLFESGPCSPC
jgi:glycosyltransferase involved in cell wall biosynthesis